MERVEAGVEAGVKGGGVGGAELGEIFKVDRHVHCGMNAAKLLKQSRLLLR
jgi:hypothetical protein